MSTNIHLRNIISSQQSDVACIIKAYVHRRVLLASKKNNNMNLLFIEWGAAGKPKTDMVDMCVNTWGCLLVDQH